MNFINLLFQWKRSQYIKALQNRGLKLGHNVYLNDGFFLDPSHCFLISIADDVVFGPNVSIFAHDASSKKVLGKTKIGRVTIGKNCFIGSGAIILPGSEIGENSIVGANATVSGIIPANEVWTGNPAKRMMSTTEYRERLQSKALPEFSEKLYRISAISSERKMEMIAILSEHRFGLMKDE